MNQFKTVLSTLLLILSTQLYAQLDQTKTLVIGDTIPEVSFKTIEDQNFSLGKDLKDQPLIIIFYRANWCPYCNEHLGDLQSYEKSLMRLGYKVVAISTESITELGNTKMKNYLKYLLLSDESKQAIKLYGVENGNVAVPTVIITDQNHVIRYIHCDPNYKLRLSGEEVYQKAQQIKSGE